MPLCPYCGTENREGAAFCVSCRRTIEPAEWLRPQVAPSPEASQQLWSAQYYDRAPYQQPMYMFAAFWPRVGAWLLDFLFASLFALIPGILAAAALGLWVDSTHEELSVFDVEGQNQQDEELGYAIGGGFMLGYVPIYVLYKTIANAKGGGWGKRIAGLRTLRERDGALPGYGTGFLRTIFPVVLALTVLFLWALDKLWCIWDGRKQTWHDKIAGTIVVVAR